MYLSLSLLFLSSSLSLSLSRHSRCLAFALLRYFFVSSSFVFLSFFSFRWAVSAWPSAHYRRWAHQGKCPLGRECPFSTFALLSFFSFLAYIHFVSPSFLFSISELVGRMDRVFVGKHQSCQVVRETGIYEAILGRVLLRWEDLLCLAALFFSFSSSSPCREGKTEEECKEMQFCKGTSLFRSSSYSFLLATSSPDSSLLRPIVAAK